MAELIHRPQVDARRVQREPVPVIQAAVLAEAVQEDHRGPRILGRPVPVVGAPAVMVDERHAMTSPKRGNQASPGPKIKAFRSAL